MSPEHLLLGLLEDESGVVAQALRASGGAEIQSLIASVAGTGPEHPIGRELRPTDETRAILERAVIEASTAEHIYVQPGHILLAIVRDPACSGSLQLLDLGVDLDCLDQHLVELLSRKTVDVDSLRQSSERYPRLTAIELRELAEQVSVWQQSSRLIGLDPSPVEGPELQRLQTRTRGAWLRLQNHHLYLAWAAAKHCAVQGHDLAYAYTIAGRALTGAVLSFAPMDGVPFEQYASSYVAGRMDQLLDCNFADDWDLDLRSQQH